MPSKATITFGADPEFFLIDTRASKPVPIVGLLGGTKSEPRIVSGYGLQEDNVMAEFTVPVCNNPRDMVQTARAGVTVVLTEIARRNTGIWPSCVAQFDTADLDVLGPQAYQFGCSPDYDAYSGGAMFPRVAPDVLNLPGGKCQRFAGGHVHIGYKSVLPDVPEYVIAMMLDLCVGLRLVYSGEEQGPRRGLYGMAGRHRPTSYGVEYRTPCNMWLYSKGIAANLVEGLQDFAFLLSRGERVLVEVFNEVPWLAVQAAINSEDVTQAYDLSRTLVGEYMTVQQ